MSEPVFLQIIMQANDLNKLNFGGRDEIEDSLEEALADSGLGEVSGGGGGSGVAIIDVDIESEDDLAEALKLIRRVLRDVVVPPSTVIKQTQPVEAVFKVYDGDGNPILSAMPRKKSPFRQFGPVENRGAVVAVQFQEELWCYVRIYFLCDGFLPFFSRSPLVAACLPTLRAERFFDLWCYDSELTPMQFVGRFPFETREESYGEPYYTPPDAIDNVYTIHEVRDGAPGMRKTKDEAEVKGMRRQRRYQPHEFHVVLADVLDVWPVIDSRG